MALRSVFCQQNVPLNAEPLREAVTSLVPNTGALVELGDLAVTQTPTASMSVNVATGRAWTPGTTANVSGEAFSTQGKYFVMNDATVNLAIAASNATYPRIDTVYLLVPDSAVSGATDTATLGVVTGTAQSSPVAPAAPAGSLTLATVAVAANATSIVNANITAAANLTLDSVPKGLVAETDYTTTSAASSALTVVANIASFTFKANRWYEVFAHGAIQNNTANTVSLVHLHTDLTTNSAANTTGITELMGYNTATIAANTAYRFHLSRKIKYTADTTVQVKLTMQPQVGGGSVQVSGGSSWPVQLGVIDLGAQF